MCVFREACLPVGVPTEVFHTEEEHVYSKMLCWNSCLRYVKKVITLRAYFKVAVLSG